MFSNFWDEYFRIIGHGKSLKLGRTRARKHFYNYKGIVNEEHGFKKLLHEQPNLYDFNPFKEYNPKENELILPRKRLDKSLRYYKEHSCSPLPKEALKILAENENIENWFNHISQVKDVEYVCSNVEYKIGKDFNNINLWKFYISYLKQNETKRLLYLYSCYCRFFIDDVEMKNEYKEACKIYGHSIVSWKNLFDFEKFKEEEIDNEIFVNDLVELVLYTDILECIKPEPNLTDNQKISTLNYINQEFSLPKTIIFYMIGNSKNSNILQKLHQCCKYFFVKMPYPVCYNVGMHQEICNNNVYKTININYTKFIKNSATIFYNPPFPDLVFGRKFIISNTFHFHHPDKLILSTFLSNIFQCNAKHLRISYQDFTLKEFKFLVGHGNVEILRLREANPVNDKNEAVELQEILHLTPKIIEFEIKKPNVTEETFKILNQMNFENKFQHLIFRSMTLLEPLEFAEFLKKNLGINSVCLPHFNGNRDSLEYKCAINILKNELKNYWPENGRPEIYDQHW